jgi:hypothetical protein
VPPVLGLHLLMGNEAWLMSENLMRNLAENRVAVIQGVFERP